jgi:hypothetical protein
LSGEITAAAGSLFPVCAIARRTQLAATRAPLIDQRLMRGLERLT